MGRYSRSRSRSRSHDDGYDADQDGYRVHVADLGIDCSQKEIEKVFSKFGELGEVWLARNPPCFAFIVFKSKSDGEEAIKEMNGKVICGARVRVSWARPRTRGRNKWDPNMRCYQCGQKGHFSRDCNRISTRKNRYSDDDDYDRRRSRRRSRSRTRSRSRSRSRRYSRRSPSYRSRSRSRSDSRDRRRRSRRSRSRSYRRRSRSDTRSPRRRYTRSRSRSHRRSPTPKRQKTRSRSNSYDNRRSQTPNGHTFHDQNENISFNNDTKQEIYDPMNDNSPVREDN